MALFAGVPDYAHLIWAPQIWPAKGEGSASGLPAEKPEPPEEEEESIAREPTDEDYGQEPRSSNYDASPQINDFVNRAMRFLR